MLSLLLFALKTPVPVNTVVNLENLPTEAVDVKHDVLLANMNIISVLMCFNKQTNKSLPLWQRGETLLFSSLNKSLGTDFPTTFNSFQHLPLLQAQKAPFVQQKQNLFCTISVNNSHNPADFPPHKHNVIAVQRQTFLFVTAMFV